MAWKPSPPLKSSGPFSGVWSNLLRLNWSMHSSLWFCASSRTHLHFCSPRKSVVVGHSLNGLGEVLLVDVLREQRGDLLEHVGVTHHEYLLARGAERGLVRGRREELAVVRGEERGSFEPLAVWGSALEPGSERGERVGLAGLGEEERAVAVAGRIHGPERGALHERKTVRHLRERAQLSIASL